LPKAEESTAAEDHAPASRLVSASSETGAFEQSRRGRQLNAPCTEACGYLETLW